MLPTLPQAVTVTYTLPAGMVFLPLRARHIAVVMALQADAMKTVQCSEDAIARLLGYKGAGGTFAGYLRVLIREGFVEIVTPASGSRARQYRLNY